MESVKTLFSKIRRNKIENEVRGFRQYRELLLILATGKDDEIETETAAEILEHTGKTQSDLQTDVETMGKRLKWREKFERGQLAAKELVACDQELERRKSDLKNAVAKLQPLVDAAYQERLRVENVMLSTKQAEYFLAENYLDPDIRDREEQLNDMKKELHEQRQPLDHAVKSGPVHRAIYEAHRKIEECERKIKGKHEVGKSREQLKYWKRKLPALETEQAALVKQLGEIDAKRTVIDREQAALHQKKLEL